MINQIIFYKDGNHMTLCFYSGGLISLIDNAGHSVKVDDKEFYDLFKSYFDSVISK